MEGVVDDHVEIVEGTTRRLTFPRVPSALAVTDPDVAVVWGGWNGLVELRGERRGTTDLWVQFGPGVAPLRLTVSVVADLRPLERALGLRPSGVHVARPPVVALGAGDLVVLTVPECASEAVPTDPGVASATVVGCKVHLRGLAAGTTDVRVAGGDGQPGELRLVDVTVARPELSALDRLVGGIGGASASVGEARVDGPSAIVLRPGEARAVSLPDRAPVRTSTSDDDVARFARLDGALALVAGEAGQADVLVQGATWAVLLPVEVAEEGTTR